MGKKGRNNARKITEANDNTAFILVIYVSGSFPNTIFIGNILFSVDPSPSCPTSFLPQAYTVPLALKITVKPSPDATSGLGV